MELFFIIVLIGLGFLFFMWKQANQNNVNNLSLSFTNFPESLGKITIFFISDIHRRIVDETIIQEAKGKADIVIIGGDLTEKGVPFERVKENLERLKSIGPSYFVWGNNDYEVDYHYLDTLMLDYGIKTLDNTAVIFESAKGDKIALLGIDDIKKGRPRLDFALEDAGEENIFKILVSHNPEIRNEILPEHQISLILSGHTHGGQIRFFNIGMYEKGGIQQFDDTVLFVSNGYGTSTIPLRLGAPPEAHLITIEKTS